MLVTVPVREFRGNGASWFVVKAEVSPSNFIFGGECRSFSAVKFDPPPTMKFERLTRDRERGER
jgi:hypothetical protein